MVSGYPDYTKPVTIAAVEIATLPISIDVGDIVGNIPIDISAQTVGDISVLLMAGVGVTNRGQIVNGDFEYYRMIAGVKKLLNWSDILGKHKVVGNDPFSGLQQITLKQGSGGLNGIHQSFSPSIPTDNIADFTIAWRNDDFTTGTFKIELYYSDGTTSVQTITCAFSVVWQKEDVTYDASKFIVGIRLFTDHATFAEWDKLNLDALSLRYREELQGIINTVDIDIVAQTIENINVDIKAQTVDLNIKTSGGVNLVIDKLTQTAYVEDRRTLSNNGETAGWANVTGTNRVGKFFPRGCRAFLDTIDVNCEDDGAAGGTITVYISPHPSMGYVASADVTVGAGASADWRSANFDRMWNYDSLFIFVVCSSADIKFGSDADAPNDGFQSTDSGASWTFGAWRLWFRAVMEGQTVGDLPISGTINAIEIPSVSATRLYIAASVTVDETTMKTINGAGTVDHLIFYTGVFADSHLTAMRIYCDGNLAFYWDFNMLNDQGFTASTPKISLLKFTEDGVCAVLLDIKFSFRRELKITGEMQTATHLFRVEGLVNLLK